ncbi:MAG TPA: bifunctional [glutamate--ammonia ligase]-adenylyl-L-tyrosine phosphorylase/[glutamate--ammonia-ligase] adenylyltransferase [Planctomycetaceae bacterium]|nr:bifunctional [glutamate--ammonia ligase]-adenylyl-L-tyrosine phosphorylase/[glutamate--ammonia-ligase] adenylyltransferase [Planctomycetaceae bacterium]
MDLAVLESLLNDPARCEDWLLETGLSDGKKAYRNLLAIIESGVQPCRLNALLQHLLPQIRWASDPDMALNNLSRYFEAVLDSDAVLRLFHDDALALPILLDIFSTSQYLSDLIIREPSLFQMVRQTEGQPLPFPVLLKELLDELDLNQKDAVVLRTLRRFKQRHLLRIAYGDIIRRQAIETVTRQISYVADAVVEGALRIAGNRLFNKRGTPRGPNGQPAQFTVLALGKLGGKELNYSSDIDLLFLYDIEGDTDRGSMRNMEYFAELGREIVRLLSAQTDLGLAYRVDMRLRPHGRRGILAMSVAEALRYYDTLGRTWERQAFIKARPIAGNKKTGEEFLANLQPWIYRRYLGIADISGIKALKRKIERSNEAVSDGTINVKTGRGGIRDIEFAIQFLQLLSGGELTNIRIGNTLEAINRLEKAGCLSYQESEILSENYRFLRKIEHRLQIMFDLQTHSFRTDISELRKLALRMGYIEGSGRTVVDMFKDAYQRKTEANRQILNHLLHDAFSNDERTAAEVDLILDPAPPREMIDEVLGKHKFRDVGQAYRSLIDLEEEKLPFFSTRRSRHFLASIAPQLLAEIAGTPDPDSTLKTLAGVADSIGGKATLWELFSFNPPSLRLCVRLCAFAPYLTDILKRDPGMLDGLMDSLVFNRLPRFEELQAMLTQLVKGAEQLEPILHAFKNDRILGVGVRDLLGKSDIRETTTAISDVAQACLTQVALAEFRNLVEKHGCPMVRFNHVDPETGNTEQIPFLGRFAIVGLGKFGGWEMNYHSDLDLLFLFDADGTTGPIGLDEENRTFYPLPDPAAVESIDSQMFYTILAQRIVKRTSQFGPWGKLYEVDLRLRPMGKKGMLAVSLDSFKRYFSDGPGELWQRQTLSKARVVFASDRYYTVPSSVIGLYPLPEIRTEMSDLVSATLQFALRCRKWEPEMAIAIREMRRRLEEASTEDQLKRGPGGIVDVEFIVQMLQLKYGSTFPGIRTQNTLAALERLESAGVLASDDRDVLVTRYRFLRTIESALRLMNLPSTSRLPDDPDLLEKLAQMVHILSGETLRAMVDEATREIATRFDRIFQKAAS